MITKKEFEILYSMIQNKEPIPQRTLSKQLGYSLGTVNKCIKEMTEKGYVDEGKITDSGRKAMEPYRVKRAVFLAAGFGSRLVPVTLNTPKPLVRVHGKRMIDTLLDAVIAAGIEDIVIVRGYLGEQFDQLLYKYPQIHFVENPIFNEANNISSAMCVRYLLQNAYVLESDLVLENPSIIRSYEYESNFLGFPVEVTDDWCMETDKNGYIISQKIGGKNCYQMIGVSFWSGEDGVKLADDLETVYNAPGGKERYWEQTPLVYKKDHYNVAARICNPGDITEIDTFSELKKIDKTYDCY